MITRRLFSLRAALLLGILLLTGLNTVALAQTASPSPSPTATPTVLNKPDANGKCILVLTTVIKADWPGGTLPANADCDAIPFVTYLRSLLRTLVPYVLFIGLIGIVFSGVQYMSSAIAGDGTKLAKQRIYAILSGVIVFFLIRVILNLLSTSISIG